MDQEEAAAVGRHEAALLALLLAVVPAAARSWISAAARLPAGPHRDAPTADPRSVWG